MDSTGEQKYLINIQGPTHGLTIGDSNRVACRCAEASTHPTPSSSKQVWNISYQHNPFFTGREDLLARLQKQLQAGQSSALSQPQAMSGLGGIGKTQIAVQYAYQHSDDYQAVLWVHAESHEALTSSGGVQTLTLLAKSSKSQSSKARDSCTIARNAHNPS